jgi:signal transduction histidine kinase
MSDLVPRRRHVPLIVAMVLATAAVAGLRVWDSERESQHAVTRLAMAQGTLARALAFDLESRLAAEEASGLERDEALARATEALLRDSAHLGAPRQTLVFVGGPGALHGSRAVTPSLEGLAASGDELLILSRDEAVKLGLPPRRAVAAWRATSRPALGVLVVASADLERVRAQREELLSVVSVLVVVALVLGFGVTAVRRDGERVRLAHLLERQRLERERDEQLTRAERVAVASALSLGIAHELATPLGVIAAKVEGLRRNATDERSVAALAVISEQVATMRQVMQGFLSLARGDAPQTTQVAAESLARAAARAVVHRFTAANVSLQLEVPEGLPMVWADETLVRQALANLLINAAQASGPGSHVTLRLSVVEGTLEFRVLDEGHGIPSAIADQVTRPFVTTRAQVGGTGLGLAITQELARHHGGTVSLGPGPGGRGTEATLRLPLSGGPT